METTNLNSPAKMFKDHKVIIDNRKCATITAVTKAVSANEGSVVLQLQNTKVVVAGKELHINKLNIVEGIAEIDGHINSIRYLSTSEPQGFFKRMFK